MNLQFLQPTDIENKEFECIQNTEYRKYKNNTEFSSDKSYFNQLKIKFPAFFDNQNTLHCGGRIQFSDLQENSKNQILLPKQSHFSHLVTLFSHLQTKHGGIKDTISQVRSKCWIINIRQLVKSIIKKRFS